MTTIHGTAALLIIDAQQGFMPTVFDANGTVSRIAKLLAAAREAGIPVIQSQEMHRREGVDFGRELDGSEGVHCLEGTADVEIVDELRPIDGEYGIIKRRYSCFFATDLDLLLRGLGVRTLIVCGFLTDVCVHYTCADAHQHDYRVKLATDAVSGSTREAHEATLQAIRYLQAESLVTVDEIVSALG